MFVSFLIYFLYNHKLYDALCYIFIAYVMIFLVHHFIAIPFTESICKVVFPVLLSPIEILDTIVESEDLNSLYLACKLHYLTLLLILFAFCVKYSHVVSMPQLYFIYWPGRQLI